MRRKTTTDPTRVSFRLDPDLAAELARKANEARTSTGRYARDLVSMALFHLDEQQQALKAIRLELVRVATSLDLLRALRTDLATSVCVLLVHAGKLEPDQAAHWVQQTLLSTPSPKEP